MAMTYTSLVASKGTTGSIANWAGYSESKLDLPAILDEAQALIYQSLRVREMRTEYTFGIGENGSRASLPSRFLDPIGNLIDTTNGFKYRHYTESSVKNLQQFEQVAGSFGNNPFTTGAANSGLVAAVLASNELTQGSDITIAGATSPIDGVTVNGTFLITAASDTGFTFKTYDAATAGGVNGGGAAATWTARKLQAGQPSCWSIWDEAIQFDMAFEDATAFRLLCFMSLPLLSAAYPSNFLTNRYPLLIRKATQAAAADYMEDDVQYQKHLAALGALIEATNAESDLSYRGADLVTETP
jgi:hypothetical protein